MSIEKNGSRYVGEQFSEEQIGNREKFWDGVLGWIRENISVEPYDIPEGAEFKKLNAILSDSTLGSILLAREHGACLVSEDYRLRVVGESECGVNGAASVEIAQLLREEGLIDEKSFIGVQVRTARWNYYFTPVSVEMLEHALEADGFLPGDELVGVLSLLRDPDTNDESIANVLALFLKRIWLEKTLSRPCQQPMVFACLDILAARPMRNRALSLFKERLNAHFNLSPLQLQEILRISRLWETVRVH